MSLLRQLAIIFLAIGLIAFLLGVLGIGTGIPWLSFLKWGVALAVILAVVELLTRGRAA